MEKSCDRFFTAESPDANGLYLIARTGDKVGFICPAVPPQANIILIFYPPARPAGIFLDMLSTIPISAICISSAVPP